MTIDPTLAPLKHHLADFEIHNGICKDAFERDVTKALDYIEEHLFDQDLSVKQLKNQCSLRNNNISSRFKLRIGVGIRRYIEQRRMEAAKRLLASGKFRIYQIAAAVGYAYPETFCKAFKRVEGCTPCEFRTRVAPLETLPFSPKPEAVGFVTYEPSVSQAVPRRPTGKRGSLPCKSCFPQ